MWKHYEKELKEKLFEKNSRNIEALINQNDYGRELNEAQCLEYHCSGSLITF